MKEHAENKMNEISENNANLIKQRDSMLHSFKMLVERIEKEKKKDDEKFQQLVITSEDVLKDLNNVRNKGEKALAMLVLCQRFESKAEQSAPFATLKCEQQEPPASESSQVKTVPKERTFLEEFSDDEDDSSIYPLEEKEMRIFQKLTNFWKRYNKVLIETTNARMERDMLALENQQLRTTLQKYLTEMAKVDSCGAPTGHRIATALPRTAQPSRFRTNLRLPQRPVSSISLIPSITSQAVSPGSRQSISRSSSAVVKSKVPRERLSTGSSNSDQWSLFL